MEDDTNTSPEVMLQFYRLMYPFKSIFTWLNQEHAPSRLFTHREFAFTIQNDTYLRYHSFNTADDLKKQVCALNPTRFEIGPVYSARPRDKKTVRPAAFSPQKRELVFDIDMTDYNDVPAAVKVLNTTLVNQFGFKHLLWVYSGRRGIHLWISDPEALDLTDDQRRALVSALTVVEGGKEMSRKVNVRASDRQLPPALWEARETLGKEFTSLILDDQDCFASQAGWKALLQLIPDPSIAKTLGVEWSGNPNISSMQKWDRLKELILKEKGDRQKDRLKFALEDIILQYTYPRIDAEVSKHRNHLLKAPFCVHPKTGRVCVPVESTNIDRFDPQSVPTVAQLLRELDNVGEEGTGWEKTSLKPYVDLLDKHTGGILEEVRRRKSKHHDDGSW